MGNIRITVSAEGYGATFVGDPNAIMAFMAFYPTVKGKDLKDINQEWFNALDAARRCGVCERTENHVISG